MTTVITINNVDADHLATVTAQMQEMGAPTIRCIRDDVHGVVLALEGSHRLAAAVELGLAPILVMLDDDEMLTCDDLGYDDRGWFDGEPARAADIRDRISESTGTYADCGTWHHFDAA